MSALWIILGTIGFILLVILIYLAYIGLMCGKFMARYLEERNK